jgi:hypothetical protein
MENYYLLSWKDTKEPLASAFAPKGTKLAQDLIPQLNGINKLPFELNLVKLSVGKNGLIESDNLTEMKDTWLDYQPNSLAWPMMSEKLKSTVEELLTGNEYIDWITATVNCKEEQKTYYIPRFNKLLDVLDTQKTMFVQGTNVIIRPVFSSSKISLFSMFSKPASHDLWKITSGLYVSEYLKKTIQEQNLSGIKFEKTRVE